MGWRQHPVLRAFCAILLSLSATVAVAYPTPVDFDGTLLRWDMTRDSPAITYEVTTDDDSFVSLYGDIVDEAAVMWSEIPTSYFRYAPVDSGVAAQVTVNFRSTIEGGDYSAGYAVFDEYDENKPLHCSIFVVIDEFVTHSSLEKTVLHELGHCLGLGHTLIPQAIMSYRLEENSYALDVDDRAAVTHLYPIDGSDPELPLGCAIGATRAPSRSAPWMFLAPLLLPLALGGGPYLRRKGPA